MGLSKIFRRYIIVFFFFHVNGVYSQVTEVRIDPQSASLQNLSSDEVFSSTIYLPLEANSESRFANVDHLEVTDNYFIILDKNVEMSNGAKFGSVFIFDKTGKFHARIPKIRTINFAVDHLAKEIVINDLGSSGSVVYYDYNGRLLRKEQRKFMFTDMAILNNETKVYYRNFYMPEGIDLLDPQLRLSNIIIDKKGDKPVGYLPYDTSAINSREVLLRF